MRRLKLNKNELGSLTEVYGYIAPPLLLHNVVHLKAEDLVWLKTQTIGKKTSLCKN